MENTNKLKILIVEDDDVLSKALQKKFIEEAFEVFDAGDGEIGLTLALKHHPDVILLDLIMPRMDGITMIGKLRDDEWGKKVPVIILSNTNPESETQIDDLIENKPSYYLIKSKTEITEIVQKVKGLVNKEK